MGYRAEAPPPSRDDILKKLPVPTLASSTRHAAVLQQTSDFVPAAH
jgi:hypothetical protein